jgi:hypothetical protein
MKRSAWLAALFALGAYGCKDMGSGPQQPAPTITQILPGSAFAGDSLTIVGTDFGSVPGSSTITIGGVTVDTVLSWSDSRIVIKIPSGSVSGTVVVSVGGVLSNTAMFVLQGASPAVSFAADIVPLFIQHGCYQCHGGNGGLVVHTLADLLRGGQHGPAIVPGNADASLIIQKISPGPPFGARMPQGGPYLDSATVGVIRAWINEGAPDN